MPLTMTRILLVDDHQMMRDGLRMLLEREEGLQVVGDAADGRAAIEQARQLAPDIIVMDIGLPGLNGIEATRQIRAFLPGAKIITLSMHSDKRYVLQMLKAGTSAYLLKNCASDELVQAIRAVQSNQRFFSKGIAETIYDHVVSDDKSAAGSAFTVLTAREREVLQLLAEGKTSKQIAAAIGRTVNTVDTFRRDIMRKLDIHSIAELTRYAIREGLTALE
jgi:DNA-binding NarL/FixJ family response regulator